MVHLYETYINDTRTLEKQTQPIMVLPKLRLEAFASALQQNTSQYLVAGKLLAPVQTVMVESPAAKRNTQKQTP